MVAPGNCSVKVAVHVRPLIGEERVRGCKECVTVTPGKPQVQIGTHSFTFDHVYGNGSSPSSVMFEECVTPLVDGLFQGYHATVLAYGQTGSGKTYTMGMGIKDSSQTGLIPQVMNAIFNKIETLKHETEFQLRVSFVEILKEEVRDLLDSASLSKSKSRNCVAKVALLGRPPVQIRESANGIITLAGSTEADVSTLHEMAACLDQGSLSRVTGSTNMNNHSSRSHAVFTITLEQMRKLNPVSPIDNSPEENTGEEYFCAKLHLVDLAGSERAKRTGSDGLRLKEGIHINKGLLALGNVINALGDEKKQKESVHVPYRDSKLTRLLQDSLGGNSKTVMIACISPADVNAKETLNTLKYANRARNIRNEPMVNRDLISCEIQMMRQQLKHLQAELYACGGGSPSDDMQILKDHIAWLEATNEDLSRDVCRYRSWCTVGRQYQIDAQERYANNAKDDGLKRDFWAMDWSDYQMDEAMSSEGSREIDGAKHEWKHALVQSTMDKQLNELNRCLVQKESEMKLFGGDAEALAQQLRKKIMELDEEKRVLQRERNCLLVEIENQAANYDEQTQKTADIHAQKLKALGAQILDLKKKQESQVELLKQKQRGDEAAKRLQAGIWYIKAQKVQFQHKMKQEVEQFQQWKASREKELLQLRKEGRRNEYEQHKLEALHHHQKMVLQIKTQEAATATKRLKELLEARKSSTRENSVNLSGHTLPGQGNEKSFQIWFDHELEIMVNVHRLRIQLEKQRQEQAALAEELASLKHVDHLSPNSDSPVTGKDRQSRLLLMSPNARKARITSLENMLSILSTTITAMASQFTEAEARECALIEHQHWNQLSSVGEARNLLQYTFTAAAEARCQLWEKDTEIKDMKDQVNELMTHLQQRGPQRNELKLKLEQKMREQVVYIASAKSDSGSSLSPSKHHVDDMMSGHLSTMSLPAPKQLKFFPSIVYGSIKEQVAFLDQTQMMVPIGQLPMKKLAAVEQTGKLWRWRSHHQWLLQFKWKWRKPWKLSEWIKHSDETIMRSRHQLQALVDMM